MKTDENTSVAYAINDCEDHWIIACPYCDHDHEATGYFDNEDPYQCNRCKEAFYADSLEGDGWRIE